VDEVLPEEAVPDDCVVDVDEDVAVDDEAVADVDFDEVDVVGWELYVVIDERPLICMILLSALRNFSNHSSAHCFVSLDLYWACCQTQFDLPYLGNTLKLYYQRRVVIGSGWQH
jgi:hypothetical protein